MFKDLFSQGAANYAQFRPSYPHQLFNWLADNVATGRRLAVDVGTGNGQVAMSLAAHFEHVVGLDPSQAQLANAPSHPRVEFRCAPAEATGVDAGAADLLVAGQAFHWFDHARFFDEVRRVVKPGGLLAVWCYGVNAIAPPVDAVVTEIYSDYAGPFWEPERHLVEAGYRDVTFPFAELTVPTFEMRTGWTLEQLTGYLGTWSALRRYVNVHGAPALDAVFAKLAAAWGDVLEREVCWPLAVRAFRL